MTAQTVKAGYQTNVLMLKLLHASKKVYDSGKGPLATRMYNQADNHRKYMRQAVSNLSWLDQKVS